MANEQHQVRNVIFRQLTKVQHRDYGPMVQAFSAALDRDPFFASRALVHICTGGSAIRDQVDAAVIALLQSGELEFRDAGQCVLLGRDVYEIEPVDLGLPGLPPFRIFRIGEYIRGSEMKVPRRMEKIARDYFGLLDSNQARADGVELRNRKAMKSAWRYFHFGKKDFPYLHSLLFESPPEGSRRQALKQIAACDDVYEQLRLAQEAKIPYTVLASVISTPETAAARIALIDRMSPQEALNARAWVERSGLLELQEVKRAYLDKVKRATASISSTEHRASAQGADEDVQAAVGHARERAMAQQERIEDDVLFLLDVSGSMKRAIELLPELVARAFPLCDGERNVIAFNDRAMPVKIEGQTYQDAKHAVRHLRDGGYTSPGAGLRYALDRGYSFGRVVVLTDGQENAQPWYSEVLRKCATPPHTIIIGLPRYDDVMARRIESAGFQVDVFEMSGDDYYALDQVVHLLGGPKAKSIVDQILEIELPRRVK